MATTYKVLGQTNPTGGIDVNVYTVGAGKSTVVSTITVANLASTAATFRIAIRPSGEALNERHYIAYNSTVGANDTTAFTIGITLAATDVITVYASTSNISFSVFGSEIN